MSALQMSAFQESTPRASRARTALTAAPALVRFILRIDRIRALVWVLGIGAMGFYFAHAVQVVAGDDASLAELAGLYADPVGRMMVGPGFGMDDPTHERFYAAGYALVLYIFIALMSVFTVVRHTRADEQAGRAELCARTSSVDTPPSSPPSSSRPSWSSPRPSSSGWAHSRPGMRGRGPSSSPSRAPRWASSSPVPRRCR